MAPAVSAGIAPAAAAAAVPGGAAGAAGGADGADGADLDGGVQWEVLVLVSNQYARPVVGSWHACQPAGSAAPPAAPSVAAAPLSVPAFDGDGAAAVGGIGCGCGGWAGGIMLTNGFDIGAALA